MKKLKPVFKLNKVMKPGTIGKNRTNPRSGLRYAFCAFTGIIAVLLSSCTTAKIFSSIDSKELASQQQTFAIIMPVISIAANSNVTPEEIEQQQKTESFNFQQEIYSWMLNRTMQGQMSIQIQELETTNAKLSQAGYPETPLTTAELCELLNVDGIMTSSFGLTKPVSQGVAVATTILLGAGLSTNKIRARLSVSDRQSAKMIWQYEEDNLSGGLGSTPSSIVDLLMKQASKQMPHMKNYRRKFNFQ